MNLADRIRQHFELSMRLQLATLEHCGRQVEGAALLLSEALLQGNKILACGAGASAAHAQYFCSALLNRYDRDRPGLPAVAVSSDAQTLAAIARDGSWRDVYAKQVKALGVAGDILLLLEDTQHDESLHETIRSAHDRAMRVIVLGSRHSEYRADLIQSGDVEILIPEATAAGALEVQLLIVNCLCDLIDIQIFGDAT